MVEYCLHVHIILYCIYERTCVFGRLLSEVCRVKDDNVFLIHVAVQEISCSIGVSRYQATEHPSHELRTLLNVHAANFYRSSVRYGWIKSDTVRIIASFYAWSTKSRHSQSNVSINYLSRYWFNSRCVTAYAWLASNIYSAKENKINLQDDLKLYDVREGNYFTTWQSRGKIGNTKLTVQSRSICRYQNPV